MFCSSLVVYSSSLIVYASALQSFCLRTLTLYLPLLLQEEVLHVLRLELDGGLLDLASRLVLLLADADDGRIVAEYLVF